jgi:nitric oxide reductase NorQ protein
MAWRLQRPLVTVACHEDTTAGDLIGRWMIDGDRMHWQDGPLTLAARHGALCYLDELIEARPDTTVVIHPLTDGRRMLPIDRRNELLPAHPDFALVVSYNPSTSARPLKPATRHRFCALDFDYPSPEDEAAIVMREGGVGLEMATALVALGLRSRRLAGEGLDEGASTRMLVRAASLIRAGASPASACRMTMVAPLTDDDEMRGALAAAVDASF